MSGFRLDKVGIRMVKEPPLYSDRPVETAEDAVRLMAETFRDYDREVFAIVNFRKNMRPINVNIVSVGVLDQSLVHPRETLKSVILSNAAYTMLVHNHPTGKVEPSKADILTTDRMNRLCEMIGVPLLDHVIVGSDKEYYSFREKGKMPLSDLSYTSDIEKLEIGGMKVAENAMMEKQKTMKVSFTVAECSEFHDAGELHEDVKTVKEALELFEKIPPERMHGIPAIGIRVTDVAEPELFTEVDIRVGNRIDMDAISYVPEIKENKAAQFAIAELIYRSSGAEIHGAIPEDIKTKIQIIDSREKQADQLKQITEKLEQGVAEVFSGDRYRQFLDTMAKFPRYSVNNSLLIMLQKPDASLCQSFTGWKEMGRYVKKGEKGIKILAPAPYTIQREKDAVDAKGKPILDQDGEPVKENVEIKVVAFKVVSTFDISQTEGKELPSIGVSELSGDVEDYALMMAALKEVSPVPMELEEIAGGAKGFYHQAEKRIAIQEGMSEVQTIKTAIHEISHALLHGEDRSTLTKEQKELIGRLDEIIDTNYGKMPVIDYLEIRAQESGFGGYAEMLKEGCVLEGYEGITTEIMELHEKLQTSDIKRSAKEVQAESVAYTVCQHYGIDTSDYSFSYVAGWSEGKEMLELKASLDTIRDTASKLIAGIGGKMKGLAKQKEEALTIPVLPKEEPQEVTKTEDAEKVDSDKLLTLSVDRQEKKSEPKKPTKRPSVRKQLKEAQEAETKKPTRKPKARTKGVEERV